jgi:hypothetical protein
MLGAQGLWAGRDSLLLRRHHCRWRAAKFRRMLGAQDLWAGTDFYRAIHAVTRDLGFSGLIRRTAPFSRFFRHTRGCGGCILTWIFTGSLSVASLHTRGFGGPILTWIHAGATGFWSEWRIDYYLRFYVPLKSLETSPLWWRAAKFRHMLGAQGHWAGRDLHRATPTETRDLGFSGIIRRIANQSPITTHEGMWRIFCNPDPQIRKYVEWPHFWKVSSEIVDTTNAMFCNLFTCIPMFAMKRIEYVRLFTLDLYWNTDVYVHLSNIPCTVVKFLYLCK